MIRISQPDVGMRAGYVVALSVMVIMCAKLYLEQRENEYRIRNTIELSYVTIRAYSPNAIDERTAGMTLDE